MLRKICTISAVGVALATKDPIEFIVCLIIIGL